MIVRNYAKSFAQLREKCRRGRPEDIDFVIAGLETADLPTTKAIDLFLGQVTNPEGIARIEYHLFHGSQIQRNYCTLFFARRNDWAPVNAAYDAGLVDWKQAYSR